MQDVQNTAVPAHQADSETPKRVSQPEAAKLLRVTVRSIGRYRRDPTFPEFFEINGRQYCDDVPGLLNWRPSPRPPSLKPKAKTSAKRAAAHERG